MVTQYERDTYLPCLFLQHCQSRIGSEIQVWEVQATHVTCVWSEAQSSVPCLPQIICVLSPDHRDWQTSRLRVFELQPTTCPHRRVGRMHGCCCFHVASVLLDRTKPNSFLTRIFVRCGRCGVLRSDFSETDPMTESWPAMMMMMMMFQRLVLAAAVDAATWA